MEREVTIQELADLLISGKISTQQYLQSLFDTFGSKTIMKSLTSSLQEAYGDIDFSKSLPNPINEIQSQDQKVTKM